MSESKIDRLTDAAARIQAAVKPLSTVGEVMDATMLIGLSAAAQADMTLDDVVDHVRRWYPSIVKHRERKVMARAEVGSS